MTEVVWSPQASAELRNAIAYIARENPYAARRMHERIEDFADDLVALSRRGTPGHAPDTFELVMPDLPYTIVYECGPSGDVHILSLWHHSRRLRRH